MSYRILVAALCLLLIVQLDAQFDRIFFDEIEFADGPGRIPFTNTEGDMEYHRFDSLHLDTRLDSIKYINDTATFYLFDIARDTLVDSLKFALVQSDAGNTHSTTLPSEIVSNISSYGFSPAYVNASGDYFAASTTSNTTLHQFYVTKYNGGQATIEVDGSLRVTATFGYIVGTTYYLQDDGSLGTSADNDGDVVDFDSSACSVVASLGSNEYIIVLKNPRHFIN